MQTLTPRRGGHYLLCTTLIGALAAPVSAGSLDVTNEFSAGTPAVAAEVNQNFTEVETAVTDNDARITTNAAGVSSNAAAISNNAGAIGSNATRIDANTAAIPNLPDCAPGEFLRKEGGVGACAAPDAVSFTAGGGLLRNGTTFSVNPVEVQTRVGNGCPAGQSIRVIEQNGTVQCEADDNTTYGPGEGLVDGGSDTFAIDEAVVQRRVSGACTGTEKMTGIGVDGTPVCAADVDTDTDTDTTYAAGPGLQLSGGRFAPANGSVSITAHAFVASGSLTQCIPVYAATFMYFAPRGTGADNAGCGANASIQLPDGATLDSLSCTVLDVAGITNALDGVLLRTNLSTASQQVIFNTPQSQNSGNLQTLSDTTPGTGTSVVDNGTYAYSIRMDWSTANFNILGALARIYNCAVAYTFPLPLP